jgi:hypothetical protein
MPPRISERGGNHAAKRQGPRHDDHAMVRRLVQVLIRLYAGTDSPSTAWAYRCDKIMGRAATLLSGS